jgi:hypothetical protein
MKLFFQNGLRVHFCQEKSTHGRKPSKPGFGFSFGLERLHDEDLINPDTLQVNLGLTKLPIGSTGICSISLTLDPFEKCPDVNRENNILEFAIKINSTVSAANHAKPRSCQVFSSFESSGNAILFSFKL